MTSHLPDPLDPIAVAQALVRCNSVTPQEGGALTLIERLLAQAGFTVERLTFHEAGTADVENLFARIGPEGPAFAFAGHTDVVPPGDEARWTRDPFAGDIAGGYLFGRGAADMKGGVAASLSAALRHVGIHGGRDAIAFLITGDEEGPAINGTVKLLDWAAKQGFRFSACLLGEPTNPSALGDMIKIGRRGSLSGRIVASGVQGHVAYPHLARNPIPAMVRLLAALTADRLDKGTAHFDASNLEVTSIDVGNPAFNVIPAEARATFNIRFNDAWKRESLEAEIRRRLALSGVPASEYAVQFEVVHSDSFVTAPGPLVEAVSAAVEAATGRRPVLSTSGGTSDARFIKDYCPVVEFGLVGQTMHQIDERVAVSDIETLTQIYQRVLERFHAATAFDRSIS